MRVCFVLRVLIDLQQFQDLALVDPGLAGDLGQALVRLVPALVGNPRVEELGLLLEQGGAEIPELLRGYSEHGGAGFTGQCRRGVPGLDLLAEDDLELVLVFLGDQRPDGVVEGVELLGREL